MLKSQTINWEGNVFNVQVLTYGKIFAKTLEIKKKSGAVTSPLEILNLRYVIKI